MDRRTAFKWLAGGVIGVLCAPLLKKEAVTSKQVVIGFDVAQEGADKSVWEWGYGPSYPSGSLIGREEWCLNVTKMAEDGIGIEDCFNLPVESSAYWDLVSMPTQEWDNPPKGTSMKEFKKVAQLNQSKGAKIG